MRGSLIVDQVDQGIGEAKLRIRIAPFAGDPGVAEQRLIGAEYQRQRIQEK